MNSILKIDPNRIHIYHELKKRRIYVGDLIYDEQNDVYELRYDESYVNSKNAIPIGPDLDLFKTVHTSKKGQLFPIFVDRIPEKTNPAYGDYCISQGISPLEENPLILLGSIGTRGPSSFVFERVYMARFSAEDIIKMRKELDVTQYDLAAAFGIKEITLQRIETGIGSDKNTIKLLQIYFSFPDVALWQLQQSGSGVHASVLSRLTHYFREKMNIKQKVHEALQITFKKSFPEEIEFLLFEKIFKLHSLGRYSGLLKTLFSCNDKSNFHSLLFEISFAYDFEERGFSLEYEVKKIPGSHSGIDFSCKINDDDVHFELVFAQQQHALTKNISNQLKSNKSYSICLGEKDAKNTLIRLQSILLGKCQNKKGEQNKFSKLVPGTHNIIVVNVEEQLLGTVDIINCFHVLYGDRAVEEQWRIGLSGLFENASDLSSELQDKFKIFRENISAVLFVKRNSVDAGVITPRLEYFLVKNNQAKSEKLQTICNNLKESLPMWKKK